jgi:poly-beta-1,6-N-acetyl-D-glucosamine synthase
MLKAVTATVRKIAVMFYNALRYGMTYQDRGAKHYEQQYHDQQPAMNRSYLLISPGRNEAKYARQTFDSVIAQTVRPALWVIVDDGSTDELPLIIAEYAAVHTWIRVVTRKDRGTRAVGPGVIEAFYAGYETVTPEDYEYLCKLDLDLVLPPRYFEELMLRMEADPQIATCSGKSYIHCDGKFVSERHSDETSLGATKFYRRKKFQQLGGFVREVMWDGIDGHRCRMHGWRACSWDVPELRFTHLRPQGTSHKGWVTGRMRHGFGQYFMGTTPIYMLANAVNRFTEKPYILAGLAMLWGYIWSAIQRKPRYDDAEFRRFLRRWQWRALFFGRRRAVEQVIRERQGQSAGVPR